MIVNHMNWLICMALSVKLWKMVLKELVLMLGVST